MMCNSIIIIVLNTEYQKKIFCILNPSLRLFGLSSFTCIGVIIYWLKYMHYKNDLINRKVKSFFQCILNVKIT